MAQPFCLAGRPFPPPRTCQTLHAKPCIRVVHVLPPCQHPDTSSHHASSQHGYVDASAGTISPVDPPLTLIQYEPFVPIFAPPCSAPRSLPSAPLTPLPPPPHPAGRTIDYSVCEAQPGDDPPIPFSFLHMAQVRAVAINRCTNAKQKVCTQQLELSKTWIAWLANLQDASFASPAAEQPGPSLPPPLAPLAAGRLAAARTAGALLRHAHHRGDRGSGGGVHGLGAGGAL